MCMYTFMNVFTYLIDLHTVSARVIWVVLRVCVYASMLFCMCMYAHMNVFTCLIDLHTVRAAPVWVVLYVCVCMNVGMHGRMHVCECMYACMCVCMHGGNACVCVC